MQAMPFYFGVSNFPIVFIDAMMKISSTVVMGLLLMLIVGKSGFLKVNMPLES
jgi:hypothetical protein